MDFDALRRETQKLIEQSQKIVQLIENRTTTTNVSTNISTNTVNRSFASVVTNQLELRDQPIQPHSIQRNENIQTTPVFDHSLNEEDTEEKYVHRHKDMGTLVIFNKQAKWCPNLIQKGYPKACSNKECLATKWHIDIDKLCLCISPIDGFKEGGVMEQDSKKRRCDGTCHPNTLGRKITYITLTACKLGIDCKREGCKHHHWDENYIRWKFFSSS